MCFQCGHTGSCLLQLTLQLMEFHPVLLPGHLQLQCFSFSSLLRLHKHLHLCSGVFVLSLLCRQVSFEARLGGFDASKSFLLLLAVGFQHSFASGQAHILADGIMQLLEPVSRLRRWDGGSELRRGMEGGTKPSLIGCTQKTFQGSIISMIYIYI